MRTFFLLAVLFWCSALQALDVSVSYASFKGVENNYAEVYLYVVGSTLSRDSSQVEASSAIEVTILFKQGEKIAQFDKYILNSPLGTEAQDFIDLKRFGLLNGSYTLEVSVIDLNDTNNKGKYVSSPFSINFGDEVCLSDIQLLTSCKPSKSESPFVKNGYFLEPAPFNFFNKNLNTLFFYAELYNTINKGSKSFVVSYSIAADSKLQSSRNIVQGHKTKQAAELSIVMVPIDISNIPSGNYVLKVEVRDESQKLVSAKALSFQRLNPYAVPDFQKKESFDLEKTFVARMTLSELEYNLRALLPKVTGDDTRILNTIIQSQDLTRMQTQLFTYWANKDPNRPKAAFDKYMEVARAIDKQFNSGFGFGFESDRGFTFMKYGRPTNLINVVDEADAAPYEIWFYDQFPFTNQRDVKFLFYNPSYAAGQYILLHSNAIGEINDPQWQIKLYKNISQSDIEGYDYLNATTVKEGNNRNAARYFNDF